MANPNHSEQPAATGSGPWLERRYFIDVARPRLTPTQLMAAVQADVPHFAPELLADFTKKEGSETGLRVGEEFEISILGPWNGCVRVTDVGDTLFEFITLEGHPEAGRIRFEAHYLDESPDTLRFEIRSRARSRDGLVAFAYSTLGVGKRVQEATWVEFCRRVAAASGGQALSDVTVETLTQTEAGSHDLERNA
ncbi:DUF1990 family protein [Hymenobacter arizonensis]|uniref:DUF1990 domain-containing protein n=1 Tax=Hymenobacter arizonensis TaxID=1227077 RepID=A0A1I5ZM57_HYMAR|nr:DUF1990 family protein [Hymenobacter arizonensis]SFQ57393.1 protein of unknown function [Hymenobacter arizonensis]